MAAAGSQQLRAKNPAPAPRCGTVWRAGNEEREGRNSDGKSDGGGDGREDEYGDEHACRDGGENRIENGIENKRENGDFRNGYRRGSEDARRRMTPTSDQQPQRKTRRPSETVASCWGPESKDGRRGS